MADPLRHRQTKGAATDMVDLTPPRHIPTLPNLPVPGWGREGLESAQPCRSRALRRRSPHHPICRPLSSCIANRGLLSSRPMPSQAALVDEPSGDVFEGPVDIAVQQLETETLRSGLFSIDASPPPVISRCPASKLQHSVTPAHGSGHWPWRDAIGQDREMGR